MAKMREAAKEGKSKFGIMFVGIKEMGKGLAATLTDPLTIITAIVKTFKFFYGMSIIPDYIIESDIFFLVSALIILF